MTLKPIMRLSPRTKEMKNTAIFTNLFVDGNVNFETYSILRIKTNE